MDDFIWDDKYSVGINSIDAQHMKLISLINEVNLLLTSGANRTAVSKIFDELIQYTRDHFAYEEKLFSDHSYRDGLKHKIEHSNFISRVLGLYGDFVSNRGVSLSQIHGFLVEWLTDHILVVDRKYQEYLTGKGVE